MKLKEMEEMAKQSRKTSTREGSLCVSTATSFFTCGVTPSHPEVSTRSDGREVGTVSGMGGDGEGATLSAGL